MSIISFIRKLYQALATCDSCGGDGGVARSGPLGGRTLCGSCVSAYNGN
jgi:formylmethanofuran dehydrogenase subunit E